MVPIRIKKLRENAIIPTYGSVEAAGCDLYACLDDDVRITPGQTIKIPTGFALEFPTGLFAGIFARSGLGVKGLRPANCVGICDSDYRGEYIVALHNDSNEDKIIQNGDRIAQLVILPYMQANFIEAEELNNTERGEGGFGSTGQ